MAPSRSSSSSLQAPSGREPQSKNANDATRKRAKRKAASNMSASEHEKWAPRRFAEGSSSAFATRLPTVSSDGAVQRDGVRFIVRKRKFDRETNPVVEDGENLELPETKRDGDDAKEQSQHAPEPLAKKHRKLRKENNVEEPFFIVKSRIAQWASKIVSDPEANLSLLKELRQFSSSHKGRSAALSILTEAQLFKDLAPAYRIRAITESEANTKVSKEVAKLRTYEQGLLSAYVRYVRSIISLSKWTPGSSNSSNAKNIRVSKATELMARVRTASCTALCELLKALPHFNEAESIANSVCILTTDREESVRNESASALRSVLSEAHRSSGGTLQLCVHIAKTLAKTAAVKLSSAPAEVVQPLLGIRFVSFPLLPISDKAALAQEKKKKGKVNARKQARIAKQHKKKHAEETALMDAEVARDLREADAEATPHELYAAKKSMLDSVCHAFFNVIQAASKMAFLKDTSSSEKDRPRAKRPPPALAASLHGLLQIATFVDTNIVEAILAALGPVLQSERLPLATRFKCLAASYAILAMHAKSQQADPDSLTSDAQTMDTCLYSSIGKLFTKEMPMNADEAITIDALQALASSSTFRQLPPTRRAAISRRLGIMATSLSPTHACTLGILMMMQFILPARLVSSIYSGKDDTVMDDADSCAAALQKFDDRIDDPDAAGAEHSASWELAALASHYHPPTQAMARHLTMGSVEHHLVSTPNEVVSITKKYRSDGGGFNPVPSPILKFAPKGKIRKPITRKLPQGLSRETYLHSLQDVAFPKLALKGFYSAFQLRQHHLRYVEL